MANGYVLLDAFLEAQLQGPEVPSDELYPDFSQSVRLAVVCRGLLLANLRQVFAGGLRSADDCSDERLQRALIVRLEEHRRMAHPLQVCNYDVPYVVFLVDAFARDDVCEERLALGVAYQDTLDDLAIATCIFQCSVAFGVILVLLEV